MQPMKIVTNWIRDHANNEHFLFSNTDLRSLLPDLSNAAFKTLLSRTVQAGHLTRVCRGLYTHKKAIPSDGLFLFHVATYLRAGDFNYISLETVLSDAGVISQIPINRITLMSSGRNSIIACGEFGTIEFVHTNQRPADIMDQLIYDTQRGLWRASIPQALRDMKTTRRNSDLIDREVAHEFI